MAALPAHAEGLYIGGNVASPDWRSPVNGLAGKDHNAAVNLYGGYTLNSNLALELGYMTLGHQNGDLGEVRGHGGYLDVVGTLPLGMSNFSLLGRLGYDRASIMTDAGSDNGGGLNFGAGLQYDLNRNVALRAEVTALPLRHLRHHHRQRPVQRGREVRLLSTGPACRPAVAGRLVALDCGRSRRLGRGVQQMNHPQAGRRQAQRQKALQALALGRIGKTVPGGRHQQPQAAGGRCPGIRRGGC
jgi:OOP family OmpA-OmpF porin